ncbi:hypothetical protein JCM9492_00030 [Aquifex pyrophilus]
MALKETKEFLGVRDVLKELESRGIKINRRTFYLWLEKGKIPSSYFVRRKSLDRVRYFFKPEIIDFLEERLS